MFRLLAVPLGQASREVVTSLSQANRTYEEAHKRGPGLAPKGIVQALDQIGLIGLVFFIFSSLFFNPKSLILIRRQTSEVTSGRKMMVVNPIRRWTGSLRNARMPVC
jgi:hypothetical protein